MRKTAYFEISEHNLHASNVFIYLFDVFYSSCFLLCFDRRVGRGRALTTVRKLCRVSSQRKHAAIHIDMVSKYYSILISGTYLLRYCFPSPKIIVYVYIVRYCQVSKSVSWVSDELGCVADW